MSYYSENSYNKYDTQHTWYMRKLTRGDSIILSCLDEFGTKWGQNLMEYLSMSDEMTAERVLEFLTYLHSSREHWCNISWTSKSKYAHILGKYIITVVIGFANQAISSKHYPSIYQNNQFLDNKYNICVDILRYANDIEATWNGHNLSPNYIIPKIKIKKNSKM